MDVLALRLDAPLMSFGSVRVDQHNRTDSLPYRAMLTGLLANALGFLREDVRGHERLQARLRYAARRDRRGTLLVDYQTVDFSPTGPMASDRGWTSRGRLEERKGGDASEGTHIRYRHYLADAVITVALTLEPSDEAPLLRTVSEALRWPERPLFIGRKCCVPSGPIWLAEAQASSLRDALETLPRVGPCRRGEKARADSGSLLAVWPRTDDDDPANTMALPRVEDRDWENSVHTGRRFYTEGLVDPPESVNESGGA